MDQKQLKSRLATASSSDAALAALKSRWPAEVPLPAETAQCAEKLTAMALELLLEEVLRMARRGRSEGRRRHAFLVQRVKRALATFPRDTEFYARDARFIAAVGAEDAAPHALGMALYTLSHEAEPCVERAQVKNHRVRWIVRSKKVTSAQ